MSTRVRSLGPETEILVAACGEVRDARAWFQKAVGAVSDPSRYAATALFLGQCLVDVSWTVSLQIEGKHLQKTATGGTLSDRL